ncbi:MAG: HD domain-containing protein [Proteobacteria bacterium]|nr:HD domain-containing protein [Pseudomonadota bacterium]MBU1581458.1 HD domain-containing protein [Pseudomonadota bacterium]MBU2454333.1 HD domain-containing protein [Pseudomonadota bacterium]MBU2627323.1 HD domain-containing protein [Pseudomonadota bacterium]
MTASEYLPIKNTQIHLIETVPFFFQTNEKDFILYKEGGKGFDSDRLKNNKHPKLYIAAKDKTAALTELSKTLNINFAKSVASKGLKQVKEALCSIVEEALTPHQSKVLDGMPETIDILLNGYDKDKKTLKYLTQIAGNSSLIVEHTINVAALTLQYCFFHGFEEKKIKELTLCALLHDIGTSQIDKAILEADRKLTQREFQVFKDHVTKGHDLIILETDFDISVATVALEHHERINGSGYPNGITKITADSQLISIIDCFEPLTYRGKAFRKSKKPFDTLNLIKKEVKDGKFDRTLFKDFTSCLIR